MAKITHNVSTPNDGLGDALRTSFVNQNSMNTELYDNKVDKIDGLGLSENDLTDALLTKLNNLNGLDLAYAPNPYEGQIIDLNGGTGVVLPLADAVNAGLMSPVDFVKAQTPPTLQQILDNNHDLTNGNNFQGTTAGSGQTGINNNGFGNKVGQNGTGNNFNGFGNGAGTNNTFNNVNLFGEGSQADANNQTVFAKDNGNQARISFADIIGFKKFELPNKNMTFAGLDDLPSTIAGGDLTGSYPNPAVLNSAVLSKLLTGLNVTGSSIVNTDNLLEAFGKLQNQINGVLGGAIYQGVYNAFTNTPTLANGTGIKGNYYVVSVAGVQNLGSGNIDFNIGDWAIYNGAIWQKVDNTDAVTSVNGFIGAVNLTSANITEVTNLYFTTARTIASQLASYVSGAGTISATDTILQAIQKLNGNISALTTAIANKVDKSLNGSDFASVKTLRANIGIENIANAGDANFTITSTTKVLITNVAITAPRTGTLPLANTFNPGQELIIADLFGTITSTNTLTITIAGSDTINGAINVVIGASYGMRRLFSDGISKWTFDAGVMRISDYIGSSQPLSNNLLVATDATNKFQTLATTIFPSLTEVSYVKGVSSPIQAQINTKQATLASGTNVKTINGNSIVGSGDLAIAAGGTVTSVTGANGITVTTGTTTPVIGLAAITVTGLTITGGATNTYLLGNGTATNFGTAVRALTLTSFVAGTNTPITAASTILNAFQNLQGQISSFFQSLRGTVSVAATAQTTFTVTFGGTQPNNTYFVGITPLNTTTAAQNFIMTKTTTSFTVSFLTGITGTVNFDWVLHQ